MLSYNLMVSSLPQVSCFGNETDIAQCRFSEGECTQQKYMSVFCSSERIDDQAGTADFTSSIYIYNIGKPKFTNLHAYLVEL